MEQANKELNVKFLNTDWLDSTDYTIPTEELVDSVNFIHTGRLSGGVLVHCAQVRNFVANTIFLYGLE